MLQTVEKALRRFGVKAGDRLAVACSHGPDSLALADALLALRRPMRLGEITLVYVHHGLRAEAEDEAQLVEAFARAHGAAWRVERVSVDRRRGLGPEEAAREARYGALQAAAEAVGARFVLLGHTASDQAETLLGRLLRGAGPVGLAGIPPARGLFLRPLLEVSRAEVEAYLRGRELEPSVDATNRDVQFQRNRLRHHVMPVLRGENPRAEEVLARAAGTLREVADALDWATGQALVQLGALPWSATAVAALPAGVAKRALLRMAKEQGASLGAAHLEALLALCQDPSGTRVLALPGLTARREYDALVLASAHDQVQDPGPANVHVEGDDGPYEVRRWLPGDRMRPMRLRGRSRKLHDLYVDAKVPRTRRMHAVVVVRQRDGEIVWAEHLGAAIGANVRVALTKREGGAINERRS